MAWQDIVNGAGQVATGVAPFIGTGAQLYGQQNAAEAVNKANTAAINNQRTTLGNIGDIYQPYTSVGAGAAAALGRAEGVNGQPADYSGFENMPGYKFAVEQGTQALQRQATAQGNAYTPNEAAAVGQYVTGTAMQDYNTYIQQLQGTAGMGATAANQLGNITYNTGANISQLMANTGQAQAGLYTGAGQTVASGVQPGYGGGGGPGSPTASGVGGLVKGIGNIYKGVSSMFGGSPAAAYGLDSADAAAAGFSAPSVLTASDFASTAAAADASTTAFADAGIANLGNFGADAGAAAASADSSAAGGAALGAGAGAAAALALPLAVAAVGYESSPITINEHYINGLEQGLASKDPNQQTQAAMELASTLINSPGTIGGGKGGQLEQLAQKYPQVQGWINAFHEMAAHPAAGTNAPRQTSGRYQF